ncbi:MAG: UPF0147 family protein [Candidatus Thermoplasmatota archaeon]|jgi:uncharacterized protein (UPF0147 family)|nr:UPF0147 family protein [Candidatus Thermoplasmatota archaeon]MCL5800082.1 UPF0147 family protein [Candidatus Thermoplasmatota archaeon]
MNQNLFNEVIQLLDELSQDVSVPKNVRKIALDSKTKLNSQKDSLDLRCAKVISTLDDLTNDPNVPSVGRTFLYTIISKLEALSKS